MWFNDIKISSKEQDESQQIRRLSSTLSHTLRSGSTSGRSSLSIHSCPYIAQSDHVFATIWRHHDGRSPHSQTGTCQDNSNPSDSLTTDPQLEDWYIIFAGTKASAASTGYENSNTLCERFATWTCHGSARYLRCGQSELPDMAAWLVWQMHEPFTVSRQPSCVLLEEDAIEGLSDKEATTCRHSLLRLFETRSTDQIYVALLTVYFVSHSFRRMSSSELTAAVRSTIESRKHYASQLKHNAIQWPADNDLLNICSPVLNSDAEGNVGFLEPSMRKFMSTVHLPGLEHGHRTMTQMCFAQIRQLGTLFIVRPWTRFREWFKSCGDWPLLRYVAKFWWCHYRLAAASHTDLSAELVRMLNIALAGQNLGQTPILLQRRIVDNGYKISQIYDLPELAAVLCNMGASEASPGEAPPSPDQWRHMRPMFGIRTPAKICLEHEPSVSDVFYANSILCIRVDSTAAVAAQLSALEIQSENDSRGCSAEGTDSCLPFLESEHPNIQDWEKIDIKELEQQTSPKFDDWELVRREVPSGSI